MRAFCAGAHTSGGGAYCATLCFTTPAGAPRSRTLADRCSASSELEATVYSVATTLEALNQPSSVVLGIALTELTRSLWGACPSGVDELLWQRCRTLLARHAVQVHWVPLSAPYAVTLLSCIERARAMV